LKLFIFLFLYFSLSYHIIDSILNATVSQRWYSCSSLENKKPKYQS
jgi:hypothetical protein